MATTKKAPKKNTKKDSAAKPTAFREWYGDNSEKLSETRQKKYREDPAVREAAKDRSRAWRENRSAGAKIARKSFAMIDGDAVRVFTIGEIADKVGRSPSNLRLLISKGELPGPMLPGVQRRYTATEVANIKSLLKKRN